MNAFEEDHVAKEEQPIPSKAWIREFRRMWVASLIVLVVLTLVVCWSFSDRFAEAMGPFGEILGGIGGILLVLFLCVLVFGTIYKVLADRREQRFALQSLAGRTRPPRLRSKEGEDDGREAVTEDLRGKTTLPKKRPTG